MFGRKKQGKDLSDRIISFLRKASLLAQYIVTSPEVIANAHKKAVSIVWIAILPNILARVLSISSISQSK